MKWDLPQNVVPDRGHRFRCRDAAVEVGECYHTAWKLHRVCTTARTRHGPQQPGAWRESEKGNSSKQCLAPSSRCRILSFAATTLPPRVNLSTVVDPTVEYILIRIDFVRTPKVGLKRLMETDCPALGPCPDLGLQQVLYKTILQLSIAHDSSLSLVLWRGNKT